MRRTVRLEDADLIREVLGNRDSHLRRVRAVTGVSAVVRGDKLVVEGDPDDVQRAEAALVEIKKVVESLGRISGREVDRIVESVGLPPAGLRRAQSSRGAGRKLPGGEGADRSACRWCW